MRWCHNVLKRAGSNITINFKTSKRVYFTPKLLGNLTNAKLYTHQLLIQYLREYVSQCATVFLYKAGFARLKTWRKAWSVHFGLMRIEFLRASMSTTLRMARRRSKKCITNCSKTPSGTNSTFHKSLPGRCLDQRFTNHRYVLCAKRPQSAMSLYIILGQQELQIDIEASCTLRINWTCKVASIQSQGNRITMQNRNNLPKMQ